MAQKFYLQLIETWSLTSDSGQVYLSNRKARALISFLSTSRMEFHPRSTLCELLWPDVDESKSRASLRQCLLSIRSSVSPDLVISDSDSVAIDRTLIATDLEVILGRIKKRTFTDEDLELSKGIPGALTDLLYTSGNFTTWVEEVRSNAIDQFSEALKGVYEAGEIDLELRFRSVQAALRLDKFDENAIRALMTLHLKKNNPSAALRVYNEFFEFLETEMDAEPAAVTQDLAISIKLAGASPSERDHTAHTAPATASTKSAGVMLAVLPFEIFGNVQDSVFLSMGLMDHLTCHLASFKSPSVISSNTTRKYMGAIPRPQEVRKELNARYVLSGMLRADATNAFLTAQLVETDDERVVWATSQNCTISELMSLDLPIAEDIARAIVPSVDAEELRNSRSMALEDLEPYHLILQAKELVFKLVYEDFVKAGLLLRRAVEIGPQFSPAHAMLADWHSINLWEGWTDNPAADRVALEQHVRKAIALSPRDGRVMALWAHNRMMFNREYDVALSLIQDAIEYCPNDAETLAWSVPTLANTRQSDTAVANAQKALDLSPYDPFVFRNEHFLGLALYVRGDYDQSAEYGLSCFRKAPNYRSNLRTTIVSLTAAGRFKEASDLVEHHKQITPDFSVAEFEKISGLRDPADRRIYASHLLEAGLPH